MSYPVDAKEFTMGSKTACNNEELVAIYRHNIQKFGFSGRTLLYSSNFLHNVKLEQYQRVLPEFLDRGDSLLDIGCGYGSLAKWLNNNIEEHEYHGIDIVPEFIEEARNKYTREGVTFDVMDLKDYQGQKDWCVLLGVVSSTPDPMRLVEQAWEKCRKGLIVDFNDMHYLPHSDYNEFDIEAQKEQLQRLGATIVEEYIGANPGAPDGYGWTILIALV
jgi:2-polyprenyl-3-methyl-5-hydroxy-6-metoxy-1,4-benzoquinol methylase